MLLWFRPFSLLPPPSSPLAQARTILLHTFREAVTQPIFGLLVLAASAVLGVYALLPFFTFGEDTAMFTAVGLDLVLLAALLLGLFAAGRTVHDEIEDRTMLTLMSKPVGRGQVLVGKFLGLLLAAAVAVGAMGLVLAAAVWFRVPGDYDLPADPVAAADIERLAQVRGGRLAGLWPQLALVWMQVGVLIAVATALSTRFGIVVTLPATLIVYLAGNLTRFVDAAATDGGFLAQGAAYAINTVLPFLRVFDLTDLTVYGRIGGEGPSAVPAWRAWLYVLAAFGYFVAYCAFVLSVALALFRRRDLAGTEG